ncbi:MAG: OmpA family protein [Pseudomonadota bacterium]
MRFLKLWAATLWVAATLAPAQAQDAEGCSDHGAVSRYPDSVLAWCQTDNFLPYRVPVGPVTGYRAIGEWIDVEGRVTRNFYSLTGGERTHAEVWKNFRDALDQAGFEIIAEGLFPERNVKGGIGGGGWLGVYYINNPWRGSGAVGKLVSGTSTSGGTGAVFGRKERADDTIYALVSLEQHSSNEVAALITIVETKPAETGLVVADAEAMGRDIEELGRTVLYGLQFAYDEAELLPESKAALDEIGGFLNTATDARFYVVGHTDAKGTHAYNMKLSSDRAIAVRAALVKDYGIAPDRLEAAGVGPLVPVFANATDGGRAKNRRVELVARE